MKIRRRKNKPKQKKNKNSSKQCNEATRKLRYILQYTDEAVNKALLKAQSNENNTIVEEISNSTKKEDSSVEGNEPINSDSPVVESMDLEVKEAEDVSEGTVAPQNSQAGREVVKNKYENLPPWAINIKVLRLMSNQKLRRRLCKEEKLKVVSIKNVIKRKLTEQKEQRIMLKKQKRLSAS